MTTSPSHIKKGSVEETTGKLVITNSTPKTVMGSGIAPPRLSNDPRSSSRNQSSFRKESVVLNIEPAVLLGVARQLPMSIPK